MFILTILCITEVDPKTALFSWKYIDGPNAFIDPLNITLPSFKDWDITASDGAYNNEPDYISLGGSESAEISYIFTIPSTQVYNVFNFQCFNEQDESSRYATCLVATPNEIIDIQLGNSYNFSINLNQIYINITLKNSQSSKVNFSLPIITAYRTPFYSDISFTQQYPVKGQTKAVICELFLNSSIGKIELHTIHVNSPHKIPSSFMPHNQIFRGEGSTSFEFTTLPIISSETRIVGMNIFDSTLKLWRLYEADDNSEIGYCIDIDPVPPFRVTYIIIETSSLNFPDALEIWHNQFNNSFLLPDPSDNYGSIATPSKTNDYCIKSFYQRHMWGGEQIDGFPPIKKYLPMEKFTLTLSVGPNDILNCADNKTNEYYESCTLVKKYGIVNKNNEFSIESQNNENYTYNVIWSSNIKSNFDSVNNYMKEYEYSGFAIDLSVAETMNYNRDLEDPQYYLIDNDGHRFKPAISSMYQLLYLYRILDLKGDRNILISDFFHPQFINVILTQGVVVNLIDPEGIDTYKLKYDMATHNRLWRVRAQMGSCLFTILEQNDPRSILHISDDFFSICLTLGALPSFYYPSWNDCRYLDYLSKLRSVYDSWSSWFRLVLFNTTYNANGIGLVKFNVDPEKQIPPIPSFENDTVFFSKNKLSQFLNTKKKLPNSLSYIEEEEEDGPDTSYSFGTIGENYCFYEASTYCNREDTEDDGLIECYEVVLMAINVTLESPNDEINVQRVVKVTFTSEQDPKCLFTSSLLSCNVNGLNVELKLSATISASSSQTQFYRVALISFKNRIGQSLGDWVRENLLAIIGSLICILVLFIAIGFGLWYICCGRKRDNGDLRRIEKKESEVRKEKRHLLKLRNEQLRAENIAKENEFRPIQVDDS